MVVRFRPATLEDAPQVAEVYLASRMAFLPFAPSAHSDEEVRSWIANRLIPAGNVTVAVTTLESGHGETEEVVGMMALEREEGFGWIDQLYLAPSAVGRGIGTQLLERARAELEPPIRLYTFQANTGARRFYERHGFRALAFGDGTGNEEGCPDVLYEWAPQVKEDERQ
ncbi:MAG TPA: GNAT family N-acetyltransferase [Chthonomonadaceae bacterium]|nr:GNAT family N-acetyltransferase [Chthonomonadaceae bacterium]